MNKRVKKIETTNYRINHRFGTKSVEELITDSVVNICNSQMILTTTDSNAYNILGSVKEVKNENRY